MPSAPGRTQRSGSQPQSCRRCWSVPSPFSARAWPGKGNNAWFVVPTILFTAVPLAAGLWRLFAVEQSWWTRAAELTPFLTGFAAPVLLLLMAYLELGRRNAISADPLP